MMLTKKEGMWKVEVKATKRNIIREEYFSISTGKTFSEIIFLI